MWYKNAGTTFFRFVTNHAFDGRTEFSSLERVCTLQVHSMQRGKKRKAEDHENDERCY